jgi:O-antigen/teichoic acid export membrane protein
MAWCGAVTTADEDVTAVVELRRSFAFRTAAAVAGLLSTFLLTVIALRVLQPRDAAVFLAIIAALSIGPLLGRLGLGPNVIRLLPAEPSRTKRRQIAGAHLLATFLLSIITAPIVGFVATSGLIGEGRAHLTVAVLTALVILIESVRLTLSDVFAALTRIRASVATTHHVRSVLVLPLVAAVALLVDEPTLTEFVAVYALVAALQLGIALTLARPDIALIHIHGLSVVRDAVKSGALLFTIDLALFTVLPGTTWLANVAFDPVHAALYSTAAALALQVTVLESLAALAVGPAAARLWAAGARDEVARTLSAVATLSAAFSSLIVVLLIVVGRPALTLAYGSEFADAHLLLVILTIGCIARAALGGSTQLLVISGHIRLAAATAIGVLAIAVPAGIVAAMHGQIALAIVSSVAVFVLNVAWWVAARSVLPRAPRAGIKILDAWRVVKRREAVVDGGTDV